MRDEIKYHSVSSDKSYFFVENLNGLDFETELAKLPYIIKLQKTFNVKLSTIIKLIKKHNIAIRDLFQYEFSKYPYRPNLTLIAENGVYTEKFSRQEFRNIITYHNVYLAEYSHISCSFREILYDLLKLKFPYFFKGVFQIQKSNREKYLRTDSKLQINDDTSIAELSRHMKNNISVKIIKKLLINPKLLDETFSSTILNIYANSFDDMYLHFTENEYYIINIQDLLKKDLEAIENKIIYHNGREIIQKNMISDKNNIIYQEFLKYFNK